MAVRDDTGEMIHARMLADVSHLITVIATFGVVTANVAAGLTRQRQQEQDISDRLEELQAAIDELRQRQVSGP